MSYEGCGIDAIRAIEKDLDERKIAHHVKSDRSVNVIVEEESEEYYSLMDLYHNIYKGVDIELNLVSIFSIGANPKYFLYNINCF